MTTVAELPAGFADKEINTRVPREQLEHAFDLPRQLKNVDKIFARVFPDGKPGAATSTKVRPAKRKRK